MRLLNFVLNTSRHPRVVGKNVDSPYHHSHHKPPPLNHNDGWWRHCCQWSCNISCVTIKPIIEFGRARSMMMKNWYKKNAQIQFNHVLITLAGDQVGQITRVHASKIGLAFLPFVVPGRECIMQARQFKCYWINNILSNANMSVSVPITWLKCMQPAP